MSIENVVVIIELAHWDQHEEFRTRCWLVGLQDHNDVVQEVWRKVCPKDLGLTIPMSSGVVVALRVFGEGAIEKVSQMKADFNLIHVSGSDKEAYHQWLVLQKADHDDYWKDMGPLMGAR